MRKKILAVFLCGFLLGCQTVQNGIGVDRYNIFFTQADHIKELLAGEQVFFMAEAEPLQPAANWFCPAKVPDTYLVYASNLSNASGLLPPSVECLRRGL